MSIPRLLAPLLHSTRRFHADDRGAIAMLLAVIAIPLLAGIGLAVDYSDALRTRSKYASLADAAALAGAKASAEAYFAFTLDKDRSKSNFLELGQDEATRVFKAQIEATPGLANLKYSAKVKRDGDNFTATVEYGGLAKGTFRQLFNTTGFEIEGRAETSMAAAISAYMDFYLLLDHSASMGVGASQRDIDKMNAVSGCAFACHEPDDKARYYDAPKAAGAKFRIDVLKESTSRIIDKARETSIKPGQVRVGLYPFIWETKVLSELSSNYAELKSRVNSIQLPSSQDGTAIRNALKWLGSGGRVKASGSGNSADESKKFVFLVTDGVENTIYRQQEETEIPKPWGYYNHKRASGAVDPAACDKLKAKGATVAILYTTYLPLPGEWRYETMVRPFAPNIARNLKACASDGFFFEASNGEEIDRALQKMFNKSVASAMARITR